MANIKSRRALSDLFKRGTEIRFGPNPTDPDGDPVGAVGPFYRTDERGQLTNERLPPTDQQVCMYIMPADPLQREMSMREANAKRAASIIRAKRDVESEEHLTVLAFLADMSDETLIDYVILGDTSIRRADAEREILARDEWKDITAYQDAMRQFEDKDPEELTDDPDWQAMMELDAKYVEQINEREGELRDAQREVLRMTCANDRSKVEKMALDKRSELVATQAFMSEYERQMMFYSVREFDNTMELFFESVDELARQPQTVRDTITEALLPYISEAGEAKNSQGAADGSETSVQPSEPETSEVSIPVEQTV